MVDLTVTNHRFKANDLDHVDSKPDSSCVTLSVPIHHHIKSMTKKGKEFIQYRTKSFWIDQIIWCLTWRQRPNLVGQHCLVIIHQCTTLVAKIQLLRTYRIDKHSLTIQILTVTLTLKIAILTFHTTLYNLLITYPTQTFHYKRFSASEYMCWQRCCRESEPCDLDLEDSSPNFSHNTL